MGFPMSVHWVVLLYSPPTMTVQNVVLGLRGEQGWVLLNNLQVSSTVPSLGKFYQRALLCDLGLPACSTDLCGRAL